MSNVVQRDFDALLAYLARYTLRKHATDVSYQELIKKAHKRYLAALTFIAEVETQAGTKNTSQRKLKSRAYLEESVSDLGAAFFCLSHGAYKPGRMMLRSALETLAKGLAATKSLKVLNEKRVFNVISDAKKISLFKKKIPAEYFSRLENLYNTLCEDVHTASAKNMARLRSLGAFPTFTKTQASALAELYLRVAVVIVSIQAMLLADVYNHMHFSNRPVVRNALNADVIKYLTGDSG